MSSREGCWMIFQSLKNVMQLFSPGVVFRVRDWDAVQGLLVPGFTRTLFFIGQPPAANVRRRRTEMSIAGDNSSASCPRSCGVIGFRRRQVNVNGVAQLLDGVVFVFDQSEVVVNDCLDVIFELLPGVEVLGFRKPGSIR